ncbi:MAG: CHAT domain-containing protein, partial [Flavobacteriales bacterium]|nr:CHAT domain-containing protein [Flavobacteriales bacterium]
KGTARDYVLDLVGDEEDDGQLTSSEIALLPFQADLVTLSACETGSGEYLAGESINSLANAFLVAGVPSIVYSHWRVEDRATAELMVEFYGGLFEGKSKAQALRDARLMYLSTQDDPLRKHPYFWASFAINGSDEPIAGSNPFRWILAMALVGLIGILALRLLRLKAGK